MRPKKKCTKLNLICITQSFGSRTVLHSRNELDSHERQFRSFQQCPTELLDITVVNVMEVVTSLEHKLENIVGNKSQFRRIQRQHTRETHRPRSVKFIDVVDHLTGQWFQMGPCQTE